MSARAGAELFDIAHGGGLGWGLNFMVNVPVVKDQLAVSASYSQRDTPGYIDNILTGDDETYSLQFNDSGTYQYDCAVHGNQMTGTLVVQ